MQWQDLVETIDSRNEKIDSSSMQLLLLLYSSIGFDVYFIFFWI